jgi:hypothetical protein
MGNGSSGIQQQQQQEHRGDFRFVYTEPAVPEPIITMIEQSPV